MKTFTIDARKLRRWIGWQSRQFDVTSDGAGVILVHMLDHPLLLSAPIGRKRIGQGNLVQPVNRTEAADITPTHRLQSPEVEIMSLVIITRVGEVVVIAPGRRLDC